ncbi:MAG: DUF4115 domain-containing protein [Alphaproteobacteria bacterium]
MTTEKNEGIEVEKTTTPKGSTVGEILKNNRLKSGKKIENIAEELRIRKSYLIAIEKSDYENIPEYPYGIGFIRSYAKYFGLDENSLINDFKKETAIISSSDHIVPIKKEDINEANTPSKKNIYISIIALIGICVIWGAISFENKEDSLPEETSEYTNQVTVIEEDNNELVNENTSEDNAIIIKEENYTGENITAVEEKEEQSIEEKTNIEEENAPKIKIFEETWIEVKTKNTLYISKVLEAGSEYKLPNVKGLSLSVGKINGADLFVNGEKMNVVKDNKKINIPLDKFLNKKESVQ